MRDFRSISPALLAQRAAPREVTLPLYLQLPGELRAPGPDAPAARNDMQRDDFTRHDMAEADFGAEAGGLTISFDADDDFY